LVATDLSILSDTGPGGLNAAPVDGAANAELIEVLADALDVPKRAVSIVGGERSRQKRVRVDGVTQEFVDSTLKSKLR